MSSSKLTDNSKKEIVHHDHNKQTENSTQADGAKEDCSVMKDDFADEIKAERH